VDSIQLVEVSGCDGDVVLRGADQRFAGAYCLHHQVNWMQVPQFRVVINAGHEVATAMSVFRVQQAARALSHITVGAVVKLRVS
jgi:hypothetical protein